MKDALGMECVLYQSVCMFMRVIHTVYPFSDSEFEFVPNVWMLFHRLVAKGVYIVENFVYQFVLIIK
jgi:hypothetical protein